MDRSVTNPMDCSQFEGLLAEAVEGKLSATEMESFRAHASACQLCGPGFAEALAGYKWLGELEEIEPPSNLIENILAETSVKDEQARKAAPSWLDRVRASLRPLVTPLLQPRLAGTFAMGFFSISALLNVAGVRLGDVKPADLKPSAIRATLTRTYYNSRAQVLRYYDNMRLVYEFQARLRDLRNALPQQQEQPRDKDKKEKDKGDRNISNQPSREEQQNYVQADPGEYEMVKFTIGVGPAFQFSPSLLGRHATKRAEAVRERRIA